MMIENQDELLDAKQAAQMMAVSERTIQRMAERRVFPKAYKAGDGTRSRWRIPRLDVENFIKQQQQDRGKKRSSTG